MPNEQEATASKTPVAVPPDKDAKRLVEAIRDNVTFKHEDTPYQLQSRLLIAQDNIGRLAVLLDERGAAAGELKRLMQIAVWRAEGDERDEGAFPENKQRYAQQLQDVLGDTWLLQANAALDAARGGVSAAELLNPSEEERADAEMRTEGARDTLPRGGGA